jgi:hypothetical protein
MGGSLDDLLRRCPSGNIEHFREPLTDLESRCRGRAFEWIVHSFAAILGNGAVETSTLPVTWLGRVVQAEDDSDQIETTCQRLWFRPRRDFVQTAVCRLYAARSHLLRGADVGYVRELSSSLEVLCADLREREPSIRRLSKLHEVYLHFGWESFIWDDDPPGRFQLLDNSTPMYGSLGNEGASTSDVDVVAALAERLVAECKRGWARDCIRLAAKTHPYGAIAWPLALFLELAERGLPSVPRAHVHWLKCLLILPPNSTALSVLDLAIDEFCVTRSHDACLIALAKLYAALMWLVEGKPDLSENALCAAVEDVGQLACSRTADLGDAILAAFRSLGTGANSRRDG